MPLGFSALFLLEKKLVKSLLYSGLLSANSGHLPSEKGYNQAGFAEHYIP